MDLQTIKKYATNYMKHYSCTDVAKTLFLFEENYNNCDISSGQYVYNIDELERIVSRIRRDR